MSSTPPESTPAPLPRSEYDLLEELDRIEDLIEEMDELRLFSRAEAESRRLALHRLLDERDTRA